MTELRCGDCRKLLGHYSRGVAVDDATKRVIDGGFGRLLDKIIPAPGIAYVELDPFSSLELDALVCPRHGERVIDHKWIRSPIRGRTKSEELQDEILLWP